MSFSATAAGTSAGASATQAAITGAKFIATSISGHTDTDSVITVESPAGTILWQSAIDVSLEGVGFHFSGIYVPGVQDAAIVGKIASSTTDCQVNISGTESRKS